MTLGAILQQFTTMLREYEGDAQAYEDPITPTRLVIQAVDRFAQDSDAFWYAWQQPAVNAQAEYCAPMLYKLRSINFFDGLDGASLGNWWPLLPVSLTQMDGLYRWVNWRNFDAIDQPRRVVIAGMNVILLSPAAIVADPIVSPNVAPLVEMEGYAIPSECFKSDGTTPLFAALTDECPLNSACHPGIAYEAMKMRIMQYPTKENMLRLPMVSAQADVYRANLCGFAMNYAPPFRFDQRYRWWGM